MKNKEYPISGSATTAKSKEGSVIPGVLIVSLVLTMILGSLLKFSLTEKRVNVAHILRHEAKNAAESVVEYGFADLIARFQRQTSFPPDELDDTKNPLTLPPTSTDFLTGASHITPTSIDLHGGIIPPGAWGYINPNDPANEFDPLKGKMVYSRAIEVLGKATAKDPTTEREITAHTMQKLSVRDAPLFGNAIFYNMDLELHPGPQMTISGPVHTNGDAYLAAVNSVAFLEGISVTGKIYHGKKKEGGHPSSHWGTVLFPDSGGNLKGMYLGGSKSNDSSWLDNRKSDWRDQAAIKWDGNVVDEAHGVPSFNPIGITDYQPDDPFTGQDEMENYAYAIIEPLLPSGHADRKTNAVREEKFAAKAGLILRVEYDPSGSATTPEGNTHIKGYKYQRTNPNDPKSDPVLDVNGDPILLPVTLPDGLIGDANPTFTGLDNTPGTTSPEEYAVAGSNGSVVGGMYDHRQDKAMTMYSLNVGKLKAVTDSVAAANTAFGGTYDINDDWNGVVYVEFPTSNTVLADNTFQQGTSNGSDKIVKGAFNTLGLQTINASQIPSPPGTIDPGFTLATNAPLYSVGNFNANGTAHPNDANAPDNADEKPAALIADSFTILSNDWDNPGEGREKSNENSTSNRTASYTEFSAAVLTGLIPTIPNAATGGSSSNTASGGAHNFPRFLERWSGKELTIRGSLVALFQSEVHTVPMLDNYSNWYSPPIRDWGFNDNFKNGYYPPGTPNYRTYRRIEFKDLTAEEYESRLSNLFP